MQRSSARPCSRRPPTSAGRSCSRRSSRRRTRASPRSSTPRERAAPRARGALAAAAIAAVVLAYGVARERAFGADAGAAGEPVLRVGVVQADLGLLEKRDAGLAGQRAHVAMTRELLADGPLDLVVWPETAIARALRRPLPLDGQLVRGDLDVALLFGGTSVFEEGGRRARANSAFLVGADGAIRDAYDKNLLIPIAEWLPFEDAWPALRASLPHAQRFRASRETPALRLGDARIATPICYEAIRPAFVRAMVRASRANLLVTLANDAWFGDSREPHLHLALARLRAIEHRRWLVRATNSGVSAIVDPAGRVRAETGVLERATLRGRVGLRDDATLYARAGDWTGAAAVAAVAAALLVATGGPKPTA
ncbi:MAG: apolipoprotein N-acyltransferase [Myxococcota bacterium]